MHLNPGDVLSPVLNFLDSLIADYGEYLFMVFAWLCFATIVWILSGGLRRKQPHGNPTTSTRYVIITMHAPPPASEPPPRIGCEPDTAWDDDEFAD